MSGDRRFAALRLTLAGPVALEAPVHVPGGMARSFAVSPSRTPRHGAFTLARQPLCWSKGPANQQHSASV